MVKTFSRYIAKFLYLQLFLTLVMLPVLVMWGLPFSLFSFLGNLFFSPCITVFLLLSSLIFFCELLYIPNQWLIYCLEKMTAGWLWVMKTFQYPCFIGCPTSAWYAVGLAALLALMVLHTRWISTVWKGVASLSVIAILSLSLASWAAPRSLVTSIACHKGRVHIIKKENNVIVVDPGVVGTRAGAASWLEYTLVPELVKRLAMTHIDHLIVLNNNQTTFQAYRALLHAIPIKHLYLPAWEGKLSWQHYRAYRALRDSAREHECTIHWLSKSEYRCMGCNVRLVSSEKRRTCAEYSYVLYTVQTIVDGQEMIIPAHTLTYQ